MALLAGAAAAVIAAVPVAAIGIMNALRPEKIVPKATSLKQAPQAPPTAAKEKPKHKIETPAPRRTAYSVLDDPNIFPTSLSGPETYATDLYRDPFSNQLYLCTENEISGADTDESLHPSGLAGVRNLDVLNGRVGNEGIRRQEQLRNGRDWSNDPSASLMRSMDVSHDTRMQHAYRAVNAFKRDGCKPPGTGLLHREEEFGANMRGLNTDNVAPIRRGIVNPYNVKMGQNAPMEPHNFSMSAAPGHEGSHGRSAFDVGQLRRKRGTIDNKALAVGRGNNPNGDLAQTVRGRHQALPRAAERDVGAAARGLGVAPAPADAANRATHAAVRGNETSVHRTASQLGGAYTVRGGDARGRHTAVARNDDTKAFGGRADAGASTLDTSRPGFTQTASHLKADNRVPADKPRFDIGGVGPPRPDRSQTVSRLKSDASAPGANPRQQLSTYDHTRASSVLARQAGRSQAHKAASADNLHGAAGALSRPPVAAGKKNISAARRAAAADLRPGGQASGQARPTGSTRAHSEQLLLASGAAQLGTNTTGSATVRADNALSRFPRSSGVRGRPSAATGIDGTSASARPAAGRNAQKEGADVSHRNSNGNKAMEGSLPKIHGAVAGFKGVGPVQNPHSGQPRVVHKHQPSENTINDVRMAMRTLQATLPKQTPKDQHTRVDFQG